MPGLARRRSVLPQVERARDRARGRPKNKSQEEESRIRVKNKFKCKKEKKDKKKQKLDRKVPRSGRPIGLTEGLAAECSEQGGRRE